MKSNTLNSINDREVLIRQVQNDTSEKGMPRVDKVGKNKNKNKSETGRNDPQKIIEFLEVYRNQFFYYSIWRVSGTSGRMQLGFFLFGAGCWHSIRTIFLIVN